MQETQNCLEVELPFIKLDMLRNVCGSSYKKIAKPNRLHFEWLIIERE